MKSFGLNKKHINRIIFLTNSTFNKRDYDRFGIELLKKNGFEVEVWDSTSVLHPDWVHNYTPPDFLDFKGLRVFDSRKELFKNISILNHDCFVILFSLHSYSFFPLHRALTKSNANYGITLMNILPSEATQEKLKNFWQNLMAKNGKVDIIFKTLLKVILPKLLKIKPAKFVFVGGKKSLTKNYLINETTDTVWAHALDYDLYLKERKKKIKLRNTAIFLDEYVPFHPHFWIGSGRIRKLDPEKYYELLNDFFDVVEGELGLKVIIAAHPISRYGEHPDYFNGRKWYRGKTAELVNQSRLVIAHNSTSLSFASLFNKPVIFVTDQDQDKIFQIGPSIKRAAKLYGKKPVFLDNVTMVNWHDEMRINKGLYEKYVEDYIKTKNSPDIPFWQIVADRLKNT